MNSYELALTAPSRPRVYLFHHLGARCFGRGATPGLTYQREPRCCAIPLLDAVWHIPVQHSNLEFQDSGICIVIMPSRPAPCQTVRFCGGCGSPATVLNFTFI